MSVFFDSALGKLAFSALWYVIYYPLLAISSIFPQSILGIDTAVLSDNWSTLISSWANAFNYVVPVHYFLSLIYCAYILEFAIVPGARAILILLNLIRGSGA
jgi:hypothetical protein